MPRGRSLLRSFALSLSFLFVAGCAGDAGPEPGQAGKDVVWLPSPPALVEVMLDLAQVTAGDTVVDLGAGDGRTVIAAARRGAKARGIEYDAGLVSLAREHAKEAGVNASFEQADLFRADFSDASVVTLFLLTELNLRLRPALLAMKPGTRIVSSTFRMGEWQPDAQVSTGCGSFCTAYLWVVPAKVEGYWESPEGELALTQEFQRVFGTVRASGVTQAFTAGRLSGSHIELHLPDADFDGTIKGAVIDGTVVRHGASAPWHAERRRL